MQRPIRPKPRLWNATVKGKLAMRIGPLLPGIDRRQMRGFQGCDTPLDIGKIRDTRHADTACAPRLPRDLLDCVVTVLRFLL